MNPPSPSGPWSHRTSRGARSSSTTWRISRSSQLHTTISLPVSPGGDPPFIFTCWGWAQAEVIIRSISGFTPTSYMYSGTPGWPAWGWASMRLPSSSSTTSPPGPPPSVAPSMAIMTPPGTAYSVCGPL